MYSSFQTKRKVSKKNNCSEENEKRNELSIIEQNIHNLSIGYNYGNRPSSNSKSYELFHDNRKNLVDVRNHIDHIIDSFKLGIKYVKLINLCSAIVCIYPNFMQYVIRSLVSAINNKNSIKRIYYYERVIYFIDMVEFYDKDGNLRLMSKKRLGISRDFNSVYNDIPISKRMYHRDELSNQEDSNLFNALFCSDIITCNNYYLARIEKSYNTKIPLSDFMKTKFKIFHAMRIYTYDELDYECKYFTIKLKIDVFSYIGYGNKETMVDKEEECYLAVNNKWNL